MAKAGIYVIKFYHISEYFNVKINIMSWYFFALATPFLYTLTNFVEKFLVEKKSAKPLLMTFLYGVISFFIGVMILFLKNFPLLEPLQIIILLISGAMLNLYLLPYFKAIQLDDVSRVVPLFQFSPVIGLYFVYS